MRKWSEGHVHIRMRKALRDYGFELIAGEYPGGSDHELFPLCVTDPVVACDFSPDPRRHSIGELVPDIVALRGRTLVIGEAKVAYDDRDRTKLDALLGERRPHLLLALRKFADERRFQQLLPIESLILFPMLVFTHGKSAASVPPGYSYLILQPDGERKLVGSLAETGV